MKNKDPNVRKRVLLFQPYQFDRVGAYLEKMARKGWQFTFVDKEERIRKSGHYFYFKKAAPQNVHYMVTPLASTSPGWDFVCPAKTFTVFVSAAEVRPPFEVNTKEERQTVVSETVRQNIVSWFFGLFYAALIYVFIMSVRFGYFSIFTSYALLVFFLLNLFLFFFFVLRPPLGLLVWVLRHRRNAENRRPLKPGSSVWTFRKSTALIAVLLLVLFGAQRLDTLAFSAADSQTDGQLFHYATFLASESRYRYTFAGGETKSFTVMKSRFSFIMDWDLQASIRGGRLRNGAPAKELDPAPFDAKRVVEIYYSSHGSIYSNTIIFFDRMMIVSDTTSQNPLTPAQVEEILRSYAGD